MQLLNSKYVYAGLINGFAQFYQYAHPQLGFDECWSKLSDSNPWLFTDDIKKVFTEAVFIKARSLNHHEQKGGEAILKSIFSDLFSEKGENVYSQVRYFTLNLFQLDDSIFPMENGNVDQKLLLKLWTEFENELQNLNWDSFNDLEKLIVIFELLKKYASYIACPNNEMVSIFESSKFLASLAHALSLSENGELPFLLVSGDISGIQPFIYNVSSKKAMVSLKGRSFYVQLLAETIAKELSEICGIAITHQIYAAGGKFYILCPNTNSVNEGITKYKTEIQSWVWAKFKSKISIQIETLAFNLKVNNKQLNADTKTDINLPIGHLWKILSEKTSESKKRKFEHLLVNEFDAFFNPFGYGGDIKVCAITGEDLEHENFVFISKDLQDQSEIVVSKEAHEQIEIGKKLYSAKYLVDTGKNTEASFQIGNHSHWELLSQLPSKPVNRCIALNQQPNGSILRNNMVMESRSFGGIPIAFYENNPATLEDLCKNEDHIENLGVLRMDVDNLGSLFMNGFGEKSEFSLMSTLSRSLDTFFSGYLNTIRNNDKYKQHVNIVYAGGDDLFAVGRWDKLFDFAIDVKSGFKKMVCAREDISISGGITIVGAKFPISKAAELAADAEDLAKDFEIYDKKKNALTLFRIPVGFEIEMPFVIEFRDDLKSWLANKQISKSLIFKLFEYYQQYLDGKPDWQWQSAYTIARYEETSSKEQKAIYSSLKELLFTKMYKNRFHNVRFEAIIVACRWAELLTKNHK